MSVWEKEKGDFEREINWWKAEDWFCLDAGHASWLTPTQIKSAVTRPCVLPSQNMSSILWVKPVAQSYDESGSPVMMAERSVLSSLSDVNWLLYWRLIALVKRTCSKRLHKLEGITLLPMPGKVFNGILLASEGEGRQAASWRAGRLSQRTIVYRPDSHRKSDNSTVPGVHFPLYLTAIDFEKAFDSFGRETLWKLLKHYGTPDKIARLIRAAYEPSTCHVVHDASLTLIWSYQRCARDAWFPLPVPTGDGLDHAKDNGREQSRDIMDPPQSPRICWL